MGWKTKVENTHQQFLHYRVSNTKAFNTLKDQGYSYQQADKTLVKWLQEREEIKRQHSNG